MPHADKDYSVITLFTMVWTEQNQLQLVKSKILTSALIAL